MIFCYTQIIAQPSCYQRGFIQQFMETDGKRSSDKHQVDLRKSRGRGGRRIMGAIGVRVTTRKTTESSKLGSQGLQPETLKGNELDPLPYVVVVQLGLPVGLLTMGTGAISDHILLLGFLLIQPYQGRKCLVSMHLNMLWLINMGGLHFSEKKGGGVGGRGQRGSLGERTSRRGGRGSKQTNK